MKIQRFGVWATSLSRPLVWTNRYHWHRLWDDTHCFRRLRIGLLAPMTGLSLTCLSGSRMLVRNWECACCISSSASRSCRMAGDSRVLSGASASHGCSRTSSTVRRAAGSTVSNLRTTQTSVKQSRGTITRQGSSIRHLFGNKITMTLWFERPHSARHTWFVPHLYFYGNFLLLKLTDNLMCPEVTRYCFLYLGTGNNPDEVRLTTARDPSPGRRRPPSPRGGTRTDLRKRDEETHELHFRSAQSLCYGSFTLLTKNIGRQVPFISVLSAMSRRSPQFFAKELLLYEIFEKDGLYLRWFSSSCFWRAPCWASRSRREDIHRSWCK